MNFYDLVLVLTLLTSIVVTNFCYSQNGKVDSLAQDGYYNPIENKNYLPKGGFQTYINGKEADSIQKNTYQETKLEKVILLSSDAELKESTSVEDLEIIVKKQVKFSPNFLVNLINQEKL